MNINNRYKKRRQKEYQKQTIYTDHFFFFTFHLLTSLQLTNKFLFQSWLILVYLKYENYFITDFGHCQENLHYFYFIIHCSLYGSSVIHSGSSSIGSETHAGLYYIPANAQDAAWLHPWHFTLSASLNLIISEKCK